MKIFSRDICRVFYQLNQILLLMQWIMNSIAHCQHGVIPIPLVTEIALLVFLLLPLPLYPFLLLFQSPHRAQTQYLNHLPFLCILLPHLDPLLLH